MGPDGIGSVALVGITGLRRFEFMACSSLVGFYDTISLLLDFAIKHVCPMSSLSRVFYAEHEAAATFVSCHSADIIPYLRHSDFNLVPSAGHNNVECCSDDNLGHVRANAEQIQSTTPNRTPSWPRPKWKRCRAENTPAPAIPYLP